MAHLPSATIASLNETIVASAEFKRTGRRSYSRYTIREERRTVGARSDVMIRIGIVGIGFMGMIHYLAARKLKGAQVTALCSRDAKKLAGDWRSIRGNFGPPGERMDLS